MSNISLKMKEKLSYTPVSNIFIDDYMISANPIFVTIYLYTLKKCTSGESTSTQEIAEKFKILESDVINAWDYWSKQNIINVNNENEIEFLEIKPKSKEQQYDKKDNTNIKKLIDEIPKYSIKELEIYQEKSNEVRELFSIAQNILGKLFTYNDLSTVFGFYDWLRMPIDVIELLLTYCASNGHCSMRYIEKVAIDWADRGINTIEKADEFIKLYNIQYKEIMKALGIASRQPIESEEKYMNTWLNEYKMPIDIIKKACNKAVIATGKPNFKYAHKILKSWNEKNIRTIKDIEKEENDYNNKPKTSNKNNYVKLNRFVNYEQREWDFEKLEKMQIDLIDKSLKE